jgi:hypothetical protein
MSQLFAPVLGRVIISQTEIIRKRIVDELMGRGVVVVGPISEQPVASATASGTPVCYRMHSFNSLDRAIDRLNDEGANPTSSEAQGRD